MLQRGAAAAGDSNRMVGRAHRMEGATGWSGRRERCRSLSSRALLSLSFTLVLEETPEALAEARQTDQQLDPEVTGEEHLPRHTPGFVRAGNGRFA